MPKRDPDDTEIIFDDLVLDSLLSMGGMYCVNIRPEHAHHVLPREIGLLTSCVHLASTRDADCQRTSEIYSANQVSSRIFASTGDCFLNI